MQEGLQLPYCPYCGRKLTFMESKNIQKQGEYFCEECGCVSKIVYKKELKIVAVTVILVSIVIVLLSYLLGDVNIFEIILTILPFIVFFVFAPYTMVLEVKNQNDIDDYYNERYYYDEDEDEDLKIYKNKKKYNRLSRFYDDSLDYDDIEKTKVFN